MAGTTGEPERRTCNPNEISYGVPSTRVLGNKKISVDYLNIVFKFETDVQEGDTIR